MYAKAKFHTKAYKLRKLNLTKRKTKWQLQLLLPRT